MKILNNKYLAASLINELEEDNAEFEKLMETMSTGDNALTEDEALEMRAWRFIKAILTLGEGLGKNPVQDKIFQEVFRLGFTPEARKVFIKNIHLFESILHEWREGG